MKVKVFDEAHEKDLEEALNLFLAGDVVLVNILYQTSHFYAGNEQVFSFSALVMYNVKEVNV